MVRLHAQVGNQSVLKLKHGPVQTERYADADACIGF